MKDLGTIKSNFSSYSLNCAESVHDFASPSLCQCACGQRRSFWRNLAAIATLCPIWTAWDLNCRTLPPETNALPADTNLNFKVCQSIICQLLKVDVSKLTNTTQQHKCVCYKTVSWRFFAKLNFETKFWPASWSSGTRLSLGLKILGSINWPVKLDAEMPRARHRSHISSKGVASVPACTMTRWCATPTRCTLRVEQQVKWNAWLDLKFFVSLLKVKFFFNWK